MALLQVEHLAKRFGGVRALDDVSLEVGAGQVVGLIGPNGAGKTTLFNVVAGALRPDGGRVVFRGRDITGGPAHVACHAGIARTFQVVQPFARLTVLDNVAAGWLFGRRGAAGRVDRAEAEARARELLDHGRLAAKASALAGTLTLSERKRLEMVRALATGPELLLLDEVLAGLNPQETEEMTGIIRRLARDLGLALLVIEHNVRAVMALSEQVVVLASGAVIARGEPAAVARDPVVVAAYLGQRRHA